MYHICHNSVRFEKRVCVWEFLVPSCLPVGGDLMSFAGNIPVELERLENAQKMGLISPYPSWLYGKIIWMDVMKAGKALCLIECCRSWWMEWKITVDVIVVLQCYNSVPAPPSSNFAEPIPWRPWGFAPCLQWPLKSPEQEHVSQLWWKLKPFPAAASLFR